MKAKSIKQCTTCKTNDTSKWYSGPVCRQCYRQLPHIKTNELAIARVSNKRWRDNNKEYCTQVNKDWVLANHEQHLLYQAQYRLQNKDKKRTWEQRDRATNLNRRIADNMRNRINMAINSNQKAGSAVKDLGCSISDLKTYLENRFQLGMTWNNHTTTGWHIDHIKPLSSFDLTDRVQFLDACNYTNLQPLWWHANLTKGCQNE